MAEVAGEGPAAINSVSYRDAGRNGTGLTIAVIDHGFIGLTAAKNNGDAPGTYTAIDYVDGDSTIEEETDHGTGCVEDAFDHCPGATWRLYRIGSASDLGAAVNNCIANGVDMISLSIVWFNMGWADNSGNICSAANNASSHGMLFSPLPATKPNVITRFRLPMPTATDGTSLLPMTRTSICGWTPTPKSIVVFLGASREPIWTSICTMPMGPR